MKRQRRFALLKTAVAWLLAMIVLVPLCALVLTSFKTKPEAATMSLALPREFLFSNYLEAIQRGGLIRAFFNSVLISTTSAVLGIVCSAMGAFVLARHRSPINRVIYTYVFLGLIAPLNYVATIRVFQVLGLMNSYLGMILLDAALGIPFAVFVYTGFVASVPRELDEAAVVDGASPATMFFRIIFPLLKPVTVTAFVLNFMGAWNDFMSPLYLLNSSKLWPMVMSVYNFFGMHFNEWNMISAVIVMSTLPILILYIAGQRYVVSGMTSGAVKL